MGTPTEPTPAAAPDELLHCPLCDYNLHGLPEPRCPECGYAFDWDELRIAIREKKSWFFEHAERRLVRSFLRTALLTFVPGRLWKKVSAGHRSSPWRLAVFAGVCLAWPLVAVLLSMLAIAAISSVLTTRTTTGLTTFAESFDWWWRLSLNRAEQLGRTMLNSGWPVLIAVILLGPFVSSFALNVFGTTLRRAGVKRVHAVRAIAYAWCAPLLVLGLTQCALWIGGTDAIWPVRRALYDSLLVPMWVAMFVPAEVFVVALPPLLWAGWCVRQSLKHYLRIPQPTLTAVLMHGVVVLAALIIATLGMMYWRDF